MLPQRGNADFRTTQPVSQGAAKAAVGRVQGGIRRRDNSHVHFAQRPAHGLYLAFLQGAQELRLHLFRCISHFIQKQAATLCLLKITHTVSLCTGERTPGATKEHSSRYTRRNRGHIHRHQRTDCALTLRVQGARYQLLAAAGFTPNKHVQAAGGNPRDVATQALHIIAAATQPVVCVGGRRRGR